VIDTALEELSESFAAWLLIGLPFSIVVCLIMGAVTWIVERKK
jgi:hypothetical protein